VDKGKHPKVVRTWLAGKIRKPPARKGETPKPEPHNKT